MTLKTCIMTASTCYREGSPITPRGIVVHSTGAANPELRRYVQPSDDDPQKAEILADLGKNKYGNDWNHKERYAGVHAFIGKNAKGKVETVQVLPYDRSAWGVGKGTRGSYNFDPTARLQFEICEDSLKDKAYFTAVMREAAEYCAHLCKTFGFDPITDISSHYESYKAGYGVNHGDPDHWLARFGCDMDWFRAEVKTIMDAGGFRPPFLIRAEWKTEAEPGSYPLLEKAKKVCPPGYTIFDSDGRCAYRAPGIRPGDRIRIREGVTNFQNGKPIPASVIGKTLAVRTVRLAPMGQICSVSLPEDGFIIGEIFDVNTESAE